MRRFLPFIGFFLLIACSSNPPMTGTGSSVSSGSGAGSHSLSGSGAGSQAGVDATGLGLTVPDDMRLEIFAQNVPGARVMVRDGVGNFWVSRPNAGVVTQLEIGTGGTIVRQNDIFRGLNKPHGLAIQPGTNDMMLYIAEETSIKRVQLYSDAPLKTIATLPTGGRHTSRTINFGPDGRLYVSIGSTCDSCVEQDPEIGTIISMNPDGSDRRTVAMGLRNAVFFDWSYVTGELFATEMGRDTLGDTTPPDEINLISTSSSTIPHFGWPYCYGDKIRDEKISSSYNCISTIAPHVALPAHVAPLGLAFVPEEGWPEDWWYDLIVAEHGSWNSSVPVGYKLVRIPLDADGNPDGEPQDFVSGWKRNGQTLGRPVDLMIEPGGTLYISDDTKGVIYRLRRTREL